MYSSSCGAMVFETINVSFTQCHAVLLQKIHEMYANVLLQ